MRFTQDAASGINLIQSYGGGELRIKDVVYRGVVLVCAARLLHQPEAVTFEALLSDAVLGVDAARLLSMDPEVILIGTGKLQIFTPPAFSARFLSRNIGLEVMSTAAACRTYNVLLTERRHVAAALLA